MLRHALLAQPIFALVLTGAGCSGPRETVASVPYQRVATVDLSKTYRTIGTRTVGDDNPTSLALLTPPADGPR